MSYANREPRGRGWERSYDFEKLNLKAQFARNSFQVKIAYSDHEAPGDVATGSLTDGAGT